MWKKLAVIGVPAVALILGATGRADAGPVNLVTNGGFEDNTGGGQLTTTVTATGWTMGTSQSPGYAFLFAPGTADTTGAGSSGFVLAGPGNNNGHGPQNGLDLSPNGGYFAALGADGKDLVLEPLTQTINNLTAGDTYQVTFYWAGAQQESLGLGATTDQLVVGFGSETQSTAGVDILFHCGQHQRRSLVHGGWHPGRLASVCIARWRVAHGRARAADPRSHGRRPDRSWHRRAPAPPHSECVGLIEADHPASIRESRRSHGRTDGRLSRPSA
jgi:hypothetical protein